MISIPVLLNSSTCRCSYLELSIQTNHSGRTHVERFCHGSEQGGRVHIITRITTKWMEEENLSVQQEPRFLAASSIKSNIPIPVGIPRRDPRHHQLSSLLLQATTSDYLTARSGFSESLSGNLSLSGNTHGKGMLL